MTKEELKEEAVKYAIDYSTSYGKGYKHKDLRITYLAGAEPREKRIEELELKIKHLTQHLEPQAMTALFEQVEEEVRREQRIKELEAYNKKLLQSDIDNHNKISALSDKVYVLQKRNYDLENIIHNHEYYQNGYKQGKLEESRKGEMEVFKIQGEVELRDVRIFDLNKKVRELEVQIEKMKQCGNCENGTIGNCEHCKRKPKQKSTDTDDYWRLMEIKENE